PEEGAARTDFRDWPTVTIDGEDAQDFDDAVSIRRLAEDRTLLGVHIADVSFYIRPDSALDREAFERATSAYFPGLTLPMLPERLSNGLCSLRPREEKRAFSALLEMNAQGEVLAAEFKPSLIRTVERLTYTSVFKIFNDDPDELRRYREIVPELRAMRELARSIRRRRREEGSLDFDLPEPELIYEEGRLQSVALTGQNEAHKLIEDFMITANEAVASFLERQQAASIYRVHPPPDPADLEKLREILLALGLFLPKPPKVTSRDLQKVLEDAAGRTEEKLVSRELLRAMRLAVYAEENQGHFGLARRTYTHFTSPIRRYPDLVVHRRLKDILSGRKTKPQGLAFTALHCSTRERNADAAEKDLMEWRIFRLLHSKLGEEFRGTVVEINKAGLLLALDDYFVEGLLAFADLGGDYYRLKSPGTVVGRRTGRIFRLGDRLSVTLAGVNPIERRMNLVLSLAKSKERP
ncbi:MAG TPA: VacB/RNase II family 3'-5' exoribonuclease, partial [Acidobacteriota bacterium]